MLKCSAINNFSTLMDANSLTALRFRAQVNKFSGILSNGEFTGILFRGLSLFTLYIMNEQRIFAPKKFFNRLSALLQRHNLAFHEPHQVFSKRILQ